MFRQPIASGPSNSVSSDTPSSTGTVSQPEQPTCDGGSANPSSASGKSGFRTLLATVTSFILLDIEAVGDILDPAYYVGRPIEDSDKMTLLTKKWVAPFAFTFPLTNGRRYSPRWEKDFDWLRYSRSCDAAFCAHCICDRAYENDP